MSAETPHFDCDCRRVSVRNVILIALAVGLFAAALRSFAFAGQPFAQAICGVIVGLAIVTYGIARLYDLDRHLPGWVYVAVVAVGIVVTILWAANLF